MSPASLKFSIFTMLCLVLALIVSSTEAAQAKNKESRYSRITVGSVEVRDWHHDIVKSYPNLSHYHWNPMYANVQGWNKVRPKEHSVKGRIPPTKSKPATHKVANKYVKYRPVVSRPKYIYKKPVHIKTGSLANGSSSTGTQARIAPSKHVTVRLNKQSLRPALSSNNTNLSLRVPRKDSANTNTSIKLDQKQVSAQLSARDTSMQLASSQTLASLEQKRTSLELIEKEPEATILKTYKPYKQDSEYGNFTMKTGAKSKVHGKVSW